ncbi:programmed cell death protein 2 isoform X2 [Eurosta solidaginis]
MVDIILGFAEERESGWLTNRYFPNKIGGKPAWLNLENLPSCEELLCIDCKIPKTFLCQIYAPYEDDHSFHRTIYVFVCRSVGCQKSNSSKYLSVYRTQLPRKNKFYSDEPPLEEGNPLPEILPAKRLCAACGCLGPSACGRCRKINYCSVKHQQLHWPHHKQHCMTETEKDSENFNISLSEITFPEWEILIEPIDGDEEAQIADDDEDSEKMRLEDYQKLQLSGQTGLLKDVTDSELEKYANESMSADDKVFRKFKKDVDEEPEQILRYKRGGNPLWIADVKQTILQQLQIPNCELCGGARQFEFQIMPQMLNWLKDDHLDWGTLCIYTCTKSCAVPKDKSYVLEYILKQDIISKENGI